jgi:hypothetical protein
VSGCTAPNRSQPCCVRWKLGKLVAKHATAIDPNPHFALHRRVEIGAERPKPYL